jgi:PAS domain S-box-containing protein
MKINFKILFGFIIGSTVLILILSVVFYNDLFNILTNQRLSEKKQEVLLRKESIEDSLRGLENEILLIKNLSSVKEYLRINSPEKRIEVENDFSKFFRENKKYNNILYINEKGEEVINITWDTQNNTPQVTPPPDLKNKSNEYYFKETKSLNDDEIFVSFVGPKDKNQDKRRYTINYSTPVFDVNNRNRGIILISIYSDSVFKSVDKNTYRYNNFLQNTYDESSNKLFLVDNSKYYLLHTDTEKEFGFIYNKEQNLGKDLPLVNEKIKIDNYGQFLDKTTNYFITFYRIKPHSERVVRVYKGSEDPDINSIDEYITQNDKDNYWAIGILLDRGKTLDRVNILFYKTISLIFLILIIFIGVMMYYLGKIIIEPIEKLRLGAERIKKGNLDYEILVENKHDEVGELANEFNSMAAVLREYKNTMEDQVQKRTADLEKFKMAVDNSFDSISITSPEGTILYTNQSTERLTGYTIREIIGKVLCSKDTWNSLMSEDFYENMWDTVKNDKKAFLAEIKSKRKNGEEYNALISITPILDKKKEIIFLISIERDISRVTKGYY